MAIKQSAQKYGRKTRFRQLKNYFYIMPAIIFLFLFTIFPVFRSGYLSFFKTDPIFSFMDFVGPEHYKKMFHSSLFWEVSWNTFVYGILQMLLSIMFGFLLALMANSRYNKFKSLFKVSVFYPYILPWTVAAMVWMYILHPTRGILNTFLNSRVQWLNSYSLTLYVLVIISTWKTAGLNFLLFLSGMQSIPEELYQAFWLESKNKLQAVWYVKIPMLGPTTFVAALLTIIGSFQSVDLIYILTQGRPGNSTNTLIYYIYQEGITKWDIGYGSALSVFLFVCLFVFTIIYLSIEERNVNYDK